jgi:hypothetical protein
VSWSADIGAAVAALWAIAAAGGSGVLMLARILWNHDARLRDLEWITGIKRKKEHGA